MSKDLLSVAFNALAAIVLLGATLAYVAPPPHEAAAAASLGAARSEEASDCSELDGVDCDEYGYGREDRDGEDEDDDDEEDHRGHGHGKP